MDLEDIFINEKTDVPEEKRKTRDLRKIFAEVFDKRTLDTLKKLGSKNIFDKIEGIIATGKEGNIFKAKKENNYCAIKIYRIETSSFDTMSKYIKGDPRFDRIKKNKQSIVYEWTKKEFKNLTTSEKAGVCVPYPIVYQNNVLVMEYLGNDDPQPVVKECKFSKKEMQDIYTQTIKNFHKLLYNAKLIHADLSEYNMIYFNKKLYFIDMGQAVTLEHPQSKEFYERDILNMVRFFNRQGINVSENEFKERIKSGK